MKLPSQETDVRRADQIWEHIAEFAERQGDDPHIWCNLPRFGSMILARIARQHQVPMPLPRREVRRLAREQLVKRRRLPPGVTGGVIGRDCVFMASHTNMQRSQAALQERFGPVRRAPSDVGASRRRSRRLMRGAIARAAEVVDSLTRSQVEFPIDAAAIHMRFLRSARLIGYWEQILARERPRVVVVGSITAPRARSLTLAAQRTDVPVVYIPHSPQATFNVRLAAMPTDYAGLRGVGEAEYLAGYGIERTRLDVVGDPTIRTEPPPDIDAGLAPVFAAGLEDPSRLAPLVGLIHAALGDAVTVGRHPAADPVGHYPPRWKVHDGRTYELLRAGPPVVIQHSSGVALEAMHLGVQVVELRYPGKEPLYPFVRTPHVHFASSAEELHAAVSTASARARCGDSRRELIDWAASWSSPTGEEAARRSIALVERAMTEGPRGPIWAPWGPSRQ